jgi:hypothetical protein
MHVWGEHIAVEPIHDIRSTALWAVLKRCGPMECGRIWPSSFSVFIDNNDREAVLEASPLLEPLHRSTRSTDIHVDRAVACALQASLRLEAFSIVRAVIADILTSPSTRLRLRAVLVEVDSGLRVRRGVFPVVLVVDTSYPVDGIAPDAVGHMRGGYTGKGRK